MSQLPPVHTDREQLDFGKAQYDNTGAPGALCAGCQQPISGTYYSSGQALVCQNCRDSFVSQSTGGSAVTRAVTAMALGLAAGLAGGLLWFIVRRATGYEIGLIAVVVGLLVGAAVRKGSGRRGGWFYQTMAIVITYCSIAGQYMPDVIQGFIEQYREEKSAMVSDSGAAASDARGADEGAATDVEPEEAAAAPAKGTATDGEADKVSAGGALFALIVVLAIALAIALAAPFLAGASNIIGLLIIGFALYEAWKMNKRQDVTLSGPFQLSQSPTPPAGA